MKGIKAVGALPGALLVLGSSIALALLLLASTPPPVIGESPETITPELSEEFEHERIYDGHLVPSDLGKVEREEEKRTEWLASPEIVQQREDSRQAYAGISASESEELLRTTFAEQLDALNNDPARFLSDAQILRPLDETAATVKAEGETSLLDSNTPVRTENEEGELSKVDLGLEPTSEGYETVNALSDVSLPSTADEEIEVGEEEFSIEQAAASHQATARLFGDKNLFYPEALPDTDLMAAPTASGVELFDLLRSRESPENIRFDLELPDASELRPDGYGGAEVVRGGEVLTVIPAPVATDAQGTVVPVEMTIDQSAIALHILHREEDFAYPILLDPIVEDWANTEVTWYWGHKLEALSNHAWIYKSNNSNIHEEICCWGGEHPGLMITAQQNVFFGPEQFGQWSYSTPNMSSYIAKAWITPWARADYSCGFSAQPHDYAGILQEPGQKWNPLIANQAPNGTLSMTGHGQGFIVGLGTGPPGVWISCPRTVYAGGVALWLDDEEQPELATSATGQWMDNVPLRLNVSATDVGLGVKSFAAVATNSSGNQQWWWTYHPCSGLYGSRCPQVWNLGDPSQPALAYEPSALPEGIDKLNVTAYDVTGKPSTATNVMTVRVDHAPPVLGLTGTLTEQAKLGTELPAYTIRANASDGVPGSENPADARSGATSLTFENDGKLVVPTYKPGCATQSCSLYQELEVPASELSAGSHTLRVKATDALGHVATKELSFSTGDKQAPSLAVTGLPAESSNPSPASYWNSFGSAGAGNGQFNHPADVAVDAQGNLWVVDENNKRVEEFNASGEYLTKFGSAGSGNGQFGRPTGIAIDSKGYIWVTDASNGRIEKFNEKGEFVLKVGTSGSGNGQFASGGPEAITADTKGNVLVGDTYNGRVEKFNEKGEFVKAIGSKGSGTGQLGEATGIDIGPGGTIWVADWMNNKVVEFNEAGEFVRQFGSSGIGNGQFAHPDVIAVDASGTVWVADEGNGRVQAFTQTGEYLSKFGSFGSGLGQFKFGYPMGIATDSKGSLWVSDSSNNRVERWVAPKVVVNGFPGSVAVTATDGGYGATSLVASVTNQEMKSEVLEQKTQQCVKGACPLGLSLSEADLSEKPPGPYMLTFTAKDGAGNLRSATRVVALDPNPPSISLSGVLAERANLPLNAPSGELTIKAEDSGVVGAGVRTIAVERDHQRIASYPFNCISNCPPAAATYRYSALRDGAERSRQNAAEPSGATLTSLKGTSCPSSSSCSAVGYFENGENKAKTLAESWGGGEWQVQASPNPAGSLESKLEGVSCSSASSCTAVGYYKTGSEAFSTLIERWDGKAWTIVASPNPSGKPRSYLYGISCATVADCWAVGKSTYTSAEELKGKNPAALLEHWNGSTWTISSLSEAPAQLRAVSCSAVNSCVAVTGQGGLATERWDGSTWAQKMASTPEGGTQVTLKSASCTAATACTAVGSYSAGGYTRPLAERWTGSQWTVQTTTDPVGVIEEGSSLGYPRSGSLEGVSCASATSCTSIGSYQSASGETVPLAEGWGGTEWALQPASTLSPPGSAATSFEAVGCSAGFECAAVGHYLGSGTRAVIARETQGSGSHRITVEAIDNFGSAASRTIDVDVPSEIVETPGCPDIAAPVPPVDVVGSSQAATAIESSLPSAVSPSVATTDETTEEKIDPSYAPPNPDLNSIGTPAEGETSVSPTGGFSLNGVACMAPAATTPAATEANVVNGDTALFANTWPQTDTVVRPTATGALMVQSIRGPNAPTSFSWNIHVSGDEEVVQLPSGSVAIVSTAQGESSEGVAALQKPQDMETPKALKDAGVQLETGLYALASAQAETSHEVLAVIPTPWVVLAQGSIVPAEIAVAPIEEIPNAYVVEVELPENEEEASIYPVQLIAEATSSRSVNGYCEKQSPCGDFDPLLGAVYASFWGNPIHPRNPTYHDYGGDNCTNFISQAVKSGYMRYMRAFDHGDGSWWSHSLQPGGQGGPLGVTYDDTESWRQADKLPRHLWQYGLAHIDPVQQPWGWTVGDILAEDWYGTSGMGEFDHLQYVVGTLITPEGREPLLANESGSGHNYPHRRWSAVRESIQKEEGAAGWNRVALAVKHTKANVNDRKHAPQNLYGPSGLFDG